MFILAEWGNVMTKSYLKVADFIREKIRSGEFDLFESIPSENKLCEITGTSRYTVRQGLSLLVNEGYIVPVQGKGYYVQKPKEDELIFFFDELSIFDERDDVSIKTVNVSIIDPSEKLELALNLPPNRKVIFLERLISKGENYVAYDCKYIPFSNRGPVVEKEMYNENFPLMLSKNQSPFNLNKEIKIRVDDLTEAEAKLLRTEQGKPLIIFEQLITNDNGDPIGLGETKFLGSYLTLSATSR